MSKTVEGMECYAIEDRNDEHFDGPLGDIDANESDGNRIKLNEAISTFLVDAARDFL